MYRRRRDRLVAILRERVPQVRVTGVAAGMHVVLELPPGSDEDDVVGRAPARADWPSTGSARSARATGGTRRRW
jgi:DNA-binding transcriptional MocR family regulator